MLAINWLMAKTFLRNLNLNYRRTVILKPRSALYKSHLTSSERKFSLPQQQFFLRNWSGSLSGQEGWCVQLYTRATSAKVITISFVSLRLLLWSIGLTCGDAYHNSYSRPVFDHEFKLAIQLIKRIGGMKELPPVLESIISDTPINGLRQLPQRWWRKEGLMPSSVSLGERQGFRLEYDIMARRVWAAAFDCLAECVALRYETWRGWTSVAMLLLDRWYLLVTGLTGVSENPILSWYLYW